MGLVSGVTAVLLLALWLLLAGCSSEEASNVPNEEETTASEPTSAEDTTPTRLTNLGGAVRPTFSPDGQKIAFLNHPEGMEINSRYVAPVGIPGLHVMNADGTDQTHLADKATGAAFSPDGEKIAFTSLSEAPATSQPKTNWPSESEIYVMNADGTDLTNLTNNPAPGSNPTWSPDGKKIAFYTLSTAPPNYDIYVMNWDGTNPTNITNTPQSGAHETMPAFSPKEEKIAFESNRETPSGIYVMNSDGSNPTRLTNQIRGMRPLFSPDGKKIAFLSEANIYLMNSDGTDIIRLINEEQTGTPIPSSPVFSPDSTKIAFRSNQEGNDEIYMVNIDGTDPTNITNNASAHDSNPAFSPDGKKMAFISQSYDESGRFVSEVYLMNLD